ncbi:hypothetical protein ACT3S8_07975, partial [Halomonas sp. AOP42-D2-25]
MMNKYLNTKKVLSASNTAEYRVLLPLLLTAIFAIAPVSMLFGFTTYKADWSIVEIFLVSL